MVRRAARHWHRLLRRALAPRPPTRGLFIIRTTLPLLKEGSLSAPLWCQRPAPRLGPWWPPLLKPRLDLLSLRGLKGCSPLRCGLLGPSP